MTIWYCISCFVHGFKKCIPSYTFLCDDCIPSRKVIRKGNKIKLTKDFNNYYG